VGANVAVACMANANMADIAHVDIAINLSLERKRLRPNQARAIVEPIAAAAKAIKVNAGMVIIAHAAAINLYLNQNRLQIHADRCTRKYPGK